MKLCNVILVDDDIDDMVFLKDAMEESGRFTVLASCDAESELINVLQHTGQLPDGIICDLNLPLKNAIDVHKGLRSLNNLSDIPFVLISGSKPLPSTETEAAEEGLSTIMVKPCSFQGYRDFCLQLYNMLAEKRA